MTSLQYMNLIITLVTSKCLPFPLASYSTYSLLLTSLLTAHPAPTWLPAKLIYFHRYILYIYIYSYNPPYKVSLSPAAYNSGTKIHILNWLVAYYKDLLRESLTYTTCSSSKSFSFHSPQTCCSALSTTSITITTPTKNLNFFLNTSCLLYLRMISQNILILLDLKYHLTSTTHCTLSTSLKNNISQQVPIAPHLAQFY